MLQSANLTFEQTRPHALLHWEGGIYITNPPNPAFEAGTQYIFKSWMINDGNEGAKVLRMLEKIYVGKPDDREAQASLVKQFEREWAKVPLIERPETAQAHWDGFRTPVRTFTDDEIRRINEGDTIYLLRRIEYSDSLGRWLSQDCHNIRVSEHELEINVIHPCHIFEEQRLRAAQ